MLSELKIDDEEGRARALNRLDILDSANEQPFENLLSLVEQVMSVPMCAITLVDRERQWFKARRGIGDTETPRDISFCTHTIQGSAPFIVSDASADSRFSNNPLVTDGLCIGSYAGIPLNTADGYNVGALCAIDDKPRNFSFSEIELLKSFAKMAMSEIELRETAANDWLTGALTRGAWIKQAQGEISRSKRYKNPLSLLIFDIDRFKSVNDTFGHSVGDLVIAALAEKCADSLRAVDIFGRYGGEEFVAILPETNIEGAAVLAERCREAFEAASVDLGNGKVVQCTVSVGAAELSEDEQFSDFLARADKALYQAKASGRNCIVTAAKPSLKTSQTL